MATLIRLLLVFSIIFQMGAKYIPLQDKTFEVHTASFNVEQHEVELQINIGEGDFLYEKITVESIEATKILFDYAKKNDLVIRDCRPVNKLSVYTTDMDTLNDKARFNKYASSSEGGDIWALFDHVSESSTESAIVLTDHGGWSQILLAHELAHYWHYRFCWDVLEDIDSEEFALKFEKIYMENK